MYRMGRNGVSRRSAHRYSRPASLQTIRCAYPQIISELASDHSQISPQVRFG